MPTITIFLLCKKCFRFKSRGLSFDLLVISFKTLNCLVKNATNIDKGLIKLKGIKLKSIIFLKKCQKFPLV